MLFKATGKYKIIDDNGYDDKMNQIHSEFEKHKETGFFNSFDGAKLFYEYIRTENAKASIVIVHGYTEFTKKYYELAWYFLNSGYNVYLYDARSHGLSHRYTDDFQMTHIDRFEDYVEDLNSYIDTVVIPTNSGTDVYLFGHSMGGATVAMFNAKYPYKAKKAVLSAPMIYPVCPPLPRQILRFLIKGEARKFGWNAKFKFSSDFNPDAKVEKSHDLSKSRFEYNLRMRVKEVRYQNSYSTNKWNFEAVSIIDRILDKKVASKTKAKSLVISAGKDTAVKLRPQKRYARLVKAQYLYFPESTHSLYTLPSDILGTFIGTLVKFYNK